MHYMDTQSWNWAWALKQFDLNRGELASRKTRHVGFGMVNAAIETSGNGG